MAAKLKKIAGQKSWSVKSASVHAWVTRQGGHLGPVVYDRKGRKIAPFSVAPWAEEKTAKGTPDIIQVLRGDFFCLPFGANTTPYKDEAHPLHGEAANSRWTLEAAGAEDGESWLHLSLDTQVRPGRVDKLIRLVDGHDVVYSQHAISGMTGPMSVGHHAMLLFPDSEGSGLISTSVLRGGQVFVEPTEKPEALGYSILKPGAEFTDLSRVPTITGRKADLTRYPARRGFEDIVQLINDPKVPFAWTAVTFPAEGYVWFGLKDPRVLPSTLCWLSNGGRHYPPWSSRHVNVMGLEEICGYFHYGLAESAAKNPLSAKGVKTVHKLKPDQPLVVNYIMGIAPIPIGFDRVATIEPSDTDGEMLITSHNGQTVIVPIELDFLAAEAVEAVEAPEKA